MHSASLPTLFQNRTFTFLWSGLVVSQIGDVFRYIALPALVFSLTGASTSVAGIIVLNAAPTLLLAPLAGFLIDHYPRRALLIISCLVRGVCSFSIPLLNQLEWIYAISFLSAVLALFYMPVIYVILPDILDRDELLQANSLTGLSYQFSQILGSGLAGLLIATAGIRWVFWIDALTFWLFAGLLILAPLRLGFPAQNHERRSTSFVRAIPKALAFLIRTPVILFTMLVFVLDTVSEASLSALMPAYTFGQLNSDARGLGLLFSLRGLGAALGLGVLAFLGRRINTTRLGLYSLVAVGSMLVVLSITRSLLIACLVLLIQGLWRVGSTLTARSLQQEHIPADLRGKIISLSMAFSSASYMLAAGAAGILGDQTRPAVVFGLAGLLLISVPFFFRGLASQAPNSPPRAV